MTDLAEVPEETPIVAGLTPLAYLAGLQNLAAGERPVAQKELRALFVRMNSEVPSEGGLSIELRSEYLGLGLSLIDKGGSLDDVITVMVDHAEKVLRLAIDEYASYVDRMAAIERWRDSEGLDGYLFDYTNELVFGAPQMQPL